VAKLSVNGEAPSGRLPLALHIIDQKKVEVCGLRNWPPALLGCACDIVIANQRQISGFKSAPSKKSCDVIITYHNHRGNRFTNQT